MPPSASPTPAAVAARAAFMRRLSYYCIGIAIGLVLMGLFTYARRQEADRAERERAAASAPGVSAEPSRTP